MLRMQYLDTGSERTAGEQRLQTQKKLHGRCGCNTGNH